MEFDRRRSIYVGAVAGVGLLAAQLIPGLDLNALLRDVSTPALIALGAYLTIRDQGNKEAERTRLASEREAERLQVTADQMKMLAVNTEAAALRADVALKRQADIAEYRERRRDLLLYQRIQPLSQNISEMAKVMGGTLVERAAEREQMELATRGIATATRELNATTQLLKGWRMEDLQYRENVITPAIGLVQNPGIETDVAELAKRVKSLETKELVEEPPSGKGE